jgi:hypothetical protein
MSVLVRRIAPPAALAALAALLAAPWPALAHESREVSGYNIVVGFIQEPVFSGQKSGLEFEVTRDDEPVEGLHETLEAEVIFGDQRRELPLSPRFGQPGWYQSVFFPTAAGAYTFHIFGEIEDTAFDESFTSGPDTFNEVQEVTTGQFPVVYPATGDLVRDAEAGAGAATTAAIALVLGGAGLLVGLVALGMSVARRRAV